MGVTFVTALFLPSGSMFKTVSKYLDMFTLLAGSGVPIILYMDYRLQEEGRELCANYANIQRCTYTTFDNSWVPKDVILPSVRNPSKDTADYMCIQLMKLRLMAEVAAGVVNTTHIAWIDFGIFHMMKNYDECTKLLQRIASGNFPTDSIITPSYKGKEYLDLFEHIYWKYCGSLLLGEKSLFPPAYAQQNSLVAMNLPKLTWEVNYWAMMEEHFKSYIASHDDSILKGVLTQYTKMSTGVTFVTALYLPSGPIFKSVESYFENFERLAMTGIPLIVYLDLRLLSRGEDLCSRYPNILRCEYVTLDTSSLPDTLKLPILRREEKDTAEYYCIQLSKLQLLCNAREHAKTTHLAWIDFGIYNIFKAPSMMDECLKQIAAAEFPTDKIMAAGCWPLPHVVGYIQYDLWDSICWRFCGGFLLGAAELFPAAAARQKELVLAHFPRLVWEVNYWTLMEEYFTNYPSDHNEAIIYNMRQFIIGGESISPIGVLTFVRHEKN